MWTNKKRMNLKLKVITAKNLNCYLGLKEVKGCKKRLF